MDRNVRLLGIVSFINDMSSEMMFPLLPFFLVSLGAPSAVVGLAGGIIEGLSGIMKVLSGYISDLKGRRKPLVFAGYALSQLSKLGIALSTSFYSAIAFMLLERSGKGIRTAPRDALIAESRKKGRAFGFHRAMDSLGAVVGAISAFFLILHGVEIRSVLLIAALAGFFSLLPLLMVKDVISSSGRAVLNLRVRKFVLFSTVFGGANLSYMFFLMKLGNSLLNAIALYAIFSLVYSVLSYPAGVISDKIGKRIVASAGYAVMCLACILAVLLPAIALIALGVFMALTDATQRSFIAEIAESYGFSMGAFQLVFGLSALVFNTFYGFLWSVNQNFVFLAVAILSMVSAFLFLRV